MGQLFHQGGLKFVELGAGVSFLAAANVENRRGPLGHVFEPIRQHRFPRHD